MYRVINRGDRGEAIYQGEKAVKAVHPRPYLRGEASPEGLANIGKTDNGGLIPERLSYRISIC